MMSFLNFPMQTDQGAPAGSHRRLQQCHPRLRGQFIPLLGVTADARANNILPTRHPSLIPWNHMIQIQLPILEALTAILADMIITLKYILTGKLDLLPG